MLKFKILLVTLVFLLKAPFTFSETSLTEQCSSVIYNQCIVNGGSADKCQNFVEEYEQKKTSPVPNDMKIVSIELYAGLQAYKAMFLAKLEKEGKNSILEKIKSNPKMIEVDEDGISFLHIASMMGLIDVMELLVNQGANVNAISENHISPLFLATLARQLESVKFLIENGAKVDSVFNPIRNGRIAFLTPLNFAIMVENVDIVKFLIENGADVNKSLFFVKVSHITDLWTADIRKQDNKSGDSFEVTPLTLACGVGNPEIIELLMTQNEAQ